MTRALALYDGRLADLSALSREPLARALALLNGDGEETRLVGGAVRDLLLGETPGDFDLATTATPDIVMARAHAAGVAFVPTGLAHGTITLLLAGKPVETTTLREDVDTDGRHAKVRFGRDFSADARRRDFTLNALSVDRQGCVHDDVGGLADLAAERVRFIGEPRQRIREDFLRILRFLRFSARFGDGRLDPEGLRAAVAERAGLGGLSAERVRAELLKLLTARRGPEVAADAETVGLISPLFGGIARPMRLKRLAEIEAVLARRPDAGLRLAAIAVAVREDAERLRERLRLSNVESERLRAAAQALEALHGRTAPPGLGDLRVLLFDRGRIAAMDAAMLAQADSGAPTDDVGWMSAHRFLADTPEPRLPFTGADLLARGFAPGRGVGETLKTLQAKWIRAGFPREPETLARLLSEALAER